MKPQNLIYLLWKIYFVPIGRSSNVRAYVFGAMFLSLLLVAGNYGDKPSTPPFDKLHVSEGIIDFTNPKRGGSSLVLKTENAPPEFFSCNGGRSIFRDCVPPKEKDRYRGRSAKVWWFYHRTVLGTKTKLAQLEVEGKVIVSYPKQKERYDAFSIPFTMGLFFALLIGYILWAPLWYFSNQRKQLWGE